MKPTIGDQIRAAIKRRGWKQKELASAMGVSQRQVSKWVNAENVEYKSLVKIQSVLPEIKTPLNNGPAAEVPDKDKNDLLWLMEHHPGKFDAMIELFRLEKELPPEVSDRLAGVLYRLFSSRPPIQKS